MEGTESAATEPAPPIAGRIDLDLSGEITLSASQRRLGLRIMPFNVVADSNYGPLLFEPGAFGTPDPTTVRLRMDHQDPPTGLGRTYEERQDAAYMEFAVSRTARGDEQLTLATDGVSRGASVGFEETGRAVRLERRGGRTVRVYGPGSAILNEVSTTWSPTFRTAGVTYVLSTSPIPSTEGTKTMSAPATTPDPAPAPVPAPVIQAMPDGALAAALDRLGERLDRSEADRPLAEKLDVMLSKFGEWQDRFQELARQQFQVPPGESGRPKPKLHHWVEVTLRRMSGQHISPTELKTLALDDVVTTEQPGLVPSVFTADYDDLINADRPFLQSTRNIVPPATGNSMTLPIITTHATAGTQAGSAEKGVLTTGATKVGTGTFAYQSVFGGADISVQMLNRAEASFFDLLTGDIAMAYAEDCEAKAIAALLAGYTDSASASHAPGDGGTLDPEDLSLGAAWERSITVYRRAPDVIWMNAAAVSAFIDAKDLTTNAPLYSNLAAAFTAAGGPGGTLSGLRPVYVPAMDGGAVDVIVGPSRGFVWAEDPARTLQADNPSNAGRDIVLAGGIFPAPRFAHAFTKYVLGS